MSYNLLRAHYVNELKYGTAIELVATIILESQAVV